MSIAFSALLILFLALPGILLCIAFRATSGRPVWFRPIADEVPIGVIISALLHAVWITLFNVVGRTVGLQVDVYSTIVLLSGIDADQLPEASKALANHFGWVALYFLSLCLVGILLGRTLSAVVRRYRLDEHFPILQSNDWYYLLRGESTHEWFEDDDYPDGVLVSARVGDYLYCGLLADYVISQSGELEAIVLEAASRRRMSDDTPSGAAVDAPGDGRPPHYAINASVLVLKYAEISNLAISGLWLEDEATQGS